jgi:hypothetical protein
MWNFIRTYLSKIKQNNMNNELFNEVDGLMKELVGKENHNHNAEVITRLFNLHNRAFPEHMEYSKSCGGCRQRVYNRLKTWWYDNGGKINN